MTPGDGNIYLVPGTIGQVHSGYGNGDGGGRLDQAASAFCLLIFPNKLIDRMFRTGTC